MPSFLSRLFGANDTKRDAPRRPPPLQRDDDIARILALLEPPADRRSSAAWDDYWRRQLSTGFAAVFDMMVDDHALVTLMRQQGWHLVLVAGNGISGEPCALSAAGFDVVAVDISPLAVKIAERIQLSETELRPFIGEGQARATGTATFVQGDLLDPTVAAGPFDVIIERRTAQGYPDDERDTLLSALAARLATEGIFLSHCHDSAGGPGREPRHVTGEWFRAHGWNILHRGEEQPSGRTAWLVSSTG